MGRGILGPLKTFISLVAGGGSPPAIAFGCAMGAMIGLLPKGNLTAAAIAVALLCTRANLTAAGLAGMAFCWVGVWTDPLAHRIGSAILTRADWQPALARFFELPLVPWTALNNTVVLGSLVLSIVLFYPVYRLTWLACDRYRASAAETLRACHAERVLAGIETATRGLARVES